MKIIGFSIALALVAGLFFWLGTVMNDKNENNIFETNQTSASMLIKYACQRVGNIKKLADPDLYDKEEKRLVILYDLYIKARSYALLNKVFFWISLISAIAVLLWPSLSVILQNNNNYEWLKSAVVQTTVTGIAALTFAFYSQYKDKQTYAENLMRYALFSEEEIAVISTKTIEEIAKIDKGFSFSNLINKEKSE